MQTSQLTCPHCGSTLNFGVEIAAGSPVECLICMQSFLAETTIFPALSSSVDTSKDRRQSIPADAPTLTGSETQTIPPQPKPSPASDKTKKAEKRKLHAKPEKSAPASAEDTVTDSLTFRPASSPQSSNEASSSEFAVETPSRNIAKSCCADSHLALIAVVCGALFLMIGVVGFAVWKLGTAEKAAPPQAKEEAVLALNPEPAKPTMPANAIPKVETKQVKQEVQPLKKDKGPAAIKIDAGEEIRKAKAAAEIVLNRSKPGGGTGLEPQWEEVALQNVKKQMAWGLDQEKVNAAIAKGVVYLKNSQNPDGTWMSGYGVGYAAIGGLTLLESDVPAKDKSVQRAATYVRNHIANLYATYELSLAILFLDRLGEPRDRPLIQGMALRLLAGQNDCGGWTYQCQRLDPPDMYQLYVYLQSHKKANPFDPLLSKGQKKQPDDLTSKNNKKKPGGGDAEEDPFQQLSNLLLTKGIDPMTNPSATGDPIPPKKEEADNPGGVNPRNPDNDPKKPAQEPKKTNPVKPAPQVQKTNPAKGKVVPIRPEWLSKKLQAYAIVRYQGKGKGNFQLRQGIGDNSNTQFALLALWAARRHDIPVDPALLAAHQRFIVSQINDGGWGYQPIQPTATPSMTCVGLLGLAMGHGAAPDIIGVDPQNPKKVLIRPALEDPKIQAGLTALSRNIGEPSLTQKDFPMENLYFLWSVERVAMLYDMRSIDGKDWYGWGAQILVHNQLQKNKNPSLDGAWPNSQFHGSNLHVNTCFALLFLKRSNLVKDLTVNLRLQTGLSGSDQ